MNYLKKYNEALDLIKFKDQTTWGSTQSIEPKKYGPIDVDYMDLIFVDFLENGATSESKEEYLYEIKITLPDTNSGKDIDEFIEYTNKSKEFALDIKSCIERVKDEYPDIFIDSYLYEHNYEDLFKIRFLNDDKNNSYRI